MTQYLIESTKLNVQTQNKQLSRLPMLCFWLWAWSWMWQAP